jgi:hypothetical protein
VINYHILLFTDIVSSIEMQYLVGDSMKYFIIGIIVFNGGLMVIVNCQVIYEKIKLHYKRWKIKRAHKR